MIKMKNNFKHLKSGLYFVMLTGKQAEEFVATLIKLAGCVFVIKPLRLICVNELCSDQLPCIVPHSAIQCSTA